MGVPQNALCVLSTGSSPLGSALEISGLEDFLGLGTSAIPRREPSRIRSRPPGGIRTVVPGSALGLELRARLLRIRTGRGMTFVVTIILQFAICVVATAAAAREDPDANNRNKNYANRDRFRGEAGTGTALFRVQLLSFIIGNHLAAARHTRKSSVGLL